ncbi:hypothetical protein [Caudoviricetes sp.]|nr:hypothetical protein [Caudoviricetes sp.]
MKVLLVKHYNSPVNNEEVELYDLCWHVCGLDSNNDPNGHLDHLTATLCRMIVTLLSKGLIDLKDVTAMLNLQNCHLEPVSLIARV